MARLFEADFNVGDLREYGISQDWHSLWSNGRGYVKSDNLLQVLRGGFATAPSQLAADVLQYQVDNIVKWGGEWFGRNGTRGCRFVQIADESTAYHADPILYQLAGGPPYQWTTQYGQGRARLIHYLSPWRDELYTRLYMNMRWQSAMPSPGRRTWTFFRYYGQIPGAPGGSYVINVHTQAYPPEYIYDRDFIRVEIGMEGSVDPRQDWWPSNASGKVVIQYTAPDKAHPIWFAGDGWRCLEFRYKKSMPGATDGGIQVWMDDQIIINSMIWDTSVGPQIMDVEKGAIFGAPEWPKGVGTVADIDDVVIDTARIGQDLTPTRKIRVRSNAVTGGALRRVG